MEPKPPHFSFITPSSPHASSLLSTSGEAQRGANALRWQAFGVEVTHRGPSRNSGSSRALACGELNSTTAGSQSNQPRPLGANLHDGVCPTDDRQSSESAHAQQSGAFIAISPHRRISAQVDPRRATSLMPNPHASRAAAAMMPPVVSRASPTDYRSLLAQDDAYVTSVASSLQWLSSGTARPRDAPHASQRNSSSTSAIWTASWNAPKKSDEAAASAGQDLATEQYVPPSLPAQAPAQKPPTDPTTTSIDDAGATPNPFLQRLHSVSAQVASAAELQRCGPPRKPSGGGGGGRQSFFRKGKKNKTPAEEGGTADAHEDAPEADGATAGSKRSRTSATKSSGKNKKKVAPQSAVSSTTERIHPWQQSGGGTDSAARRTLLPFYGSGQPGGGAGGAATNGGDQGATGGTVASGVHTVSAIPFETLSETGSLLKAVREALDDPDRIQAPPLFVGFTTTAAAGLHSNFSISSEWGGKLHFSPNVDPREAHRAVQWVVLRWRDKVYALPPDLALPFLVRVLEELVGVEVITFHAPALALVLLSFLDGRPLFTHCLSDVRVMAWLSMSMQSPSEATPAAAVSARTSAAVSSEAAAGAPPVVPSRAEATRRGGAGAEEVCDVNTLFINHLSKCVPTPPRSAKSGRAPADDTVSHAAFLQTLVNQVYYLSPLYRTLYGQLGIRGLLQAFIRQEKGCALLLANMKLHGMLVDMNAVRQFQQLCLADKKRWGEKAEALVPGLMPGFNLQSPDQCRRAIYEELQLGRYLLEPATGAAEGDASRYTHATATAPALSTTKTGKLSTAEDTLRLLAQHHPFPLYLLRYRKSAKLLQTYVDGMMANYAIPCEDADGPAPMEPGVTAQGEASLAVGTAVPLCEEEGMDLFSDDMLAEKPSATDDVPDVNATECGEEVAGDGDAEASDFRPTTLSAGHKLPATRFARVHANFLQEGTDTGRLSCAEPNLQNLPRPSTVMTSESTITTTSLATCADESKLEDNGEGVEEDRAFRRCFIAPHGHVLVSVDYEQIELRVLAHLCADPALVNALTHSVDIHTTIAQQVFKKSPVTSEERSMAKRVVFGVLYGAGPRTLAAQMGVTVERAVHVSGLLRGAFPQIDVYHQRVLQQARADGFVRTMSGRLRYLPDVNSGVMGKRAYAERQAFNTVVQGTAADIMKMSMLSVERHVLQVWPRHVRLLSQIHDELVFAVAKSELATVVPVLTKAMTQAAALLVPLRVAVKFGPTLGDLQTWTVEHDLGVGDL